MKTASYATILRSLSRNVKEARVRLGISQEEAAHRAGMLTRQWQRIEAGNPVTLRTLVSAAAVLGVEPADLIKR